VGVGLFSLFFYTKPRRRYYTPLIFTIFYFLGYLLYFTHMLIHKDEMPVTGYMSIGVFEFTDSKFFPVALVICAGMGGIMTATLIAERIFRYRSRLTRVKRIELESFSKTKLCRWIWLWFGFSVCLILLMWGLEIGRTGLRSKTQLPFKLEGVFYFFRKIFIPFCGIFLLDLCLKVNKKNLATLVLIFLLILGTLGSLGAISRKVLPFTILPAVLFLLLTSQRNNLNQKLFFRFIVISTIAMVCIVPFVQVLRNVGFQGENLCLGDSLIILSGYRDFDFSRMISTFLTLATQRIGGMAGLLAVASSGIAETEIPLKLFIGDSLLSSNICYAAYGFNPIVNGTLAFGIGFGMWGGLFLSGSYLVVYFGTILLVGIVLCFEEVFLRKGIYSVALLFSIVLGFEFWGGSASMFLLSRYFVLLLVCYLSMLFILKNTQRRLRKKCDSSPKRIVGT